MLFYDGPGNLWNLRMSDYATYKLLIWSTKTIILQVR